MVETIAIASGKGGVGKTSLAVNCAIELSNQKSLVGLLDADFGLANAHIMLDQKVNKFFKGNEWDILKICSKLYHDQTVFALLEGKVPHTIFSAH